MKIRAVGLITCKAEFKIPSHLKEARERHVMKFTQFEFNQQPKFNHFLPPHYHLPSPPDTYVNTTTAATANGYEKEGKEGVPGAGK